MEPESPHPDSGLDSPGYAVIAGIQWAAVHRRMRGNRDPR